MALPVITTQAVPGLCDVTLLARLRGAQSALLTQASAASITWTLTDLTAGTTVITGSASPSTALFNTLQTDGSWTKDSTAYPGPDGAAGYNFALTIPGANISPGGDRYQVDVLFTLTAGGQLCVVFQFNTLKVYV